MQNDFANIHGLITLTGVANVLAFDGFAKAQDEFTMTKNPNVFKQDDVAKTQNDNTFICCIIEFTFMLFAAAHFYTRGRNMSLQQTCYHKAISLKKCFLSCEMTNKLNLKNVRNNFLTVKKLYRIHIQ